LKFPCLKQHPDGSLLELKIQPRSSRNQIVGMHDTALKIKLTAPPVDGAANKACREFLAKQFNIAKMSVVLVSGKTSRHKVVLLKGLGWQRADQVLSVLL
jgi:uncharacterized protein (TIGR00251 family)